MNVVGWSTHIEWKGGACTLTPHVDLICIENLLHSIEEIIVFMSFNEWDVYRDFIVYVEQRSRQMSAAMYWMSGGIELIRSEEQSS